MGTQIEKDNERKNYIKRKQKSSRRIQNMSLYIVGGLLVLGIIASNILSLELFKEFANLKNIIDKINTGLFSGAIGILLIILGLERSLDFSNIENTLEYQHSILNDIKINLTTQTKYFQDTEAKLDNLESQITEVYILCKKVDTQTNLIKQMESIKHIHFDTFLNDVFSDLIDKNINFIKDGILRQRVVFTEHDAFELAYSKTLEKLQPSKFYATASANKNYFWTKKGKPNSTVEKSVKKFISEGGEMHRIFFVEEEEFKDQDVIDVLNKQIDLGVNVYILSKNDVNDQINEYFGVDENNRICWNVFTDESNYIRRFEYSINEEEAKKNNKRFERLIKNNNIRKYPQDFQ